MFTGFNKQLLESPWLHRLAIYTGFKSEKLTKLVEDILIAQLNNLDKPQFAEDVIYELMSKTKSVKYAQSS